MAEAARRLDVALVASTSPPAPAGPAGDDTDGVPLRAALGVAVALAPDAMRPQLEALLRQCMGLDGSARGGGGDLLTVYQVGQDLADLDALLASKAAKRDRAAAVDAWLTRLGDADRLARLGRYLAALEAGHTAHSREGQRLVALGRSEKARRELLRERLEAYLRQHGQDSVRAGDFVFQVITPRRRHVRLLCAVDQLPPQYRGTRVEWIPREDDLAAAYDAACAAREAREAEIAALVEDGTAPEEAAAMFPPGPVEDVLAYVEVEERTGQHLRITRAAG